MIAATGAETGQWITIIVMAFALGMDAFSLGIGIGLRGIRLWEIVKVSMVNGLFHVLMPLAGMVAGHFIGDMLGGVATMAGALLILLGTHMIVHALRQKEKDSNLLDFRSSFGLLLFAFSVSIDSMSVGLTLGLFSVSMIATVTMFGAFGGLMSGIGLLIGRRAGNWIGEYGEALGGIILLAFGIRFLI